MRLVLVTLLALPSFAVADGGSDIPPPKPAVSCEGALVFDEKSGKCVNPEQSNLDRDEIYLAVRQLAYAGRYIDAQQVLEALPEDDTGRLTYLGFTHRKLGNTELAMHYYRDAIDRDPDNNLARSYMGQGLVEQGETELAMVQLRHIQTNGGTGTWSEISLRRALQNGETFNY